MKNTILLLIAVLLTACTTPQTVGKVKKHNYNHKPYIALKFKRANHE